MTSGLGMGLGRSLPIAGTRKAGDTHPTGMLLCWDKFAQNEEKALGVGNAHPSRPLDPPLITTEHMFGVFIHPNILCPWMCHRWELSESVNSSIHEERLTTVLLIIQLITISL